MKDSSYDIKSFPSFLAWVACFPLVFILTLYVATLVTGGDGRVPLDDPGQVMFLVIGGGLFYMFIILEAWEAIVLFIVINAVIGGIVGYAVWAANVSSLSLVQSILIDAGIFASGAFSWWGLWVALQKTPSFIRITIPLLLVVVLRLFVP